jgi:hypothetical protein
MRPGTGLESPPRPGRLRVVDPRQDLREGAVDAVGGRFENECTTLPELERDPELGRDRSELGPQGVARIRATRVPHRELTQQASQRARAHEGARVDDGRDREEATVAEPPGERVGRRDVVDGPDCDLRVHEVLNEVERGRCRGTTRGLETRRKINH